MEETGLSITAWAKAAGVARTTVSRPLSPTYEFVTSSRTLAKLAEAAGRAAPDLPNMGQARVEPAFLEVRYRVQAGHWIESDSFVQQFLEPPRPVAPDPAYADCPQWLELVVGDSIDREIPEGAYAHVIDAIALGYSPRDGDLVVVERRRDGGHLRERSIKQVQIRDGLVELWPRSHNPLWAKPLALDDHTGDGVEVEIVGLVIGSYRSHRR